jgi:hypothetical protein
MLIWKIRLYASISMLVYDLRTDSAGGMKIFCTYMYNMQKKNTFNSANVGQSQARVILIES